MNSRLLFLAGWIAFQAFAGEGAEKPPNLILILADDVSADELSLYGGKISMPNLEKLAKEGVRFKNGWSSPLCGPSRAMIMTGKYPHHTGYYENAVPAPYEKDPRHLLILKMLQQAGYATSMIGKKHDGDDADGGVYGADDWMIARYWQGHDGPRQNRWTPDRSGMYGVSWYWHPGFIRNGKGQLTRESDFGPDLELEHLLAFVTSNQDRPFAVLWMANLPHKAHDESRQGDQQWYYTDVPALDAKGRSTGDKVPGSLASNMEYLDHLLGKLRDELQERGLSDRTILFFTADNGTADIRGKNKVMDKGSYDRDDSIRVPFVVGGGPVKPRGASDVLVDFTDFWPTFAQLAGFRGPMNTDGHSFAPYLLGEPFTPRETIQMAMNNARWVRDKDWLLDGRGRFYDTHRAESREGYRDVTLSKDPQVVAARKRFAKYLNEIPLPDENDPSTAKEWKRFRTSPDGAPVEVYHPPYPKP
jgi:arylsulfatase A-like enzyme